VQLLAMSKQCMDFRKLSGEFVPATNESHLPTVEDVDQLVSSPCEDDL